MTAWAIAATCLCVLAVAVLLVAEARQRPVLRAVSKLVAAGSFVAVALVALPTTPFGWWIVLGLACGAIGDALLLRRERRWFQLGVVAFLVGHLAYVVAMHHRLPAAHWLGGHVVGVIILVAALAAWLGRRVGDDAPASRGLVLVYLAVIAVMIVATTSPAWHGARDRLALQLALAGVLFAISDVAVARQRFLQPSLANKLVGLPTYFAAQLLFAWSMGR